MSRPIPFTWYIAGPMSGIPRFNIPLFDEVAQFCRNYGIDVISPAELDEPAYRERCLLSKDGRPFDDGPTWGSFLARDVAIVADQCDGLILLPGWKKSRGARLEVMVGLMTGKEFREFARTGTEPFIALHNVPTLFVKNDLQWSFP